MRYLSQLRLPVILGALCALTGCLADFDEFQIVGGSEDTGPPPEDTEPPPEDTEPPPEDTEPPPEDGGDAGPGDNPIDLGVPCNNPHLALLLTADTSYDSGRLYRYNLPAGGEATECRATDLLREQGAFGTNPQAITGMPDGSEVLGTTGAILGLDGQGFPEWRWQLWDYDSSDYNQLELFPLFVGTAAAVIGALHCDSYCSGGPPGVLMLDASGIEINHTDEPGIQSRIVSAAPHPDGSRRIVVAGQFYAPQVFAISATTTEMPRDAGTDFAGWYDIDSVGNTTSLEADLVEEKLIVLHQDGIVVWPADGSGGPTIYTSGDCSNYVAAAIDPHSTALYVVCRIGSAESLISLRPSEDYNVILDGTTLGGSDMVDVTLVHGSL